MVNHGPRIWTSTFREDRPSRSQEREYDPYLRKKPRDPVLTNVQAFFFLIQGIVGTGILQGVFVFRQGWLTGLILTSVISIICTHCLHILFQAKYRLCRQQRVPYLNYAQSVERALENGPPSLQKYSVLSHYLVDGCFILCQLGLCCIFATMALSLAPVVDDLLRNWLSFKINMSVLFSGSILLPVILSSLMIDLKIVARFCIIGVILLMTSGGILLGFLLDESKPAGSFAMFDINVKTLPIYVATLVFSFQVVTVATHIDDNLKSPKTFARPCGIISLGMYTVTIIQCVLGLIVYWRFDNDDLTISTIPIFFVTNDILVVSTAFYMVDAYISYGVHEYIFVEIMWTKTEQNSACTRILVCALPIIASCTYMLARSYTESLLPECIITIVLGTTVPILGIILPALMDISLNWPNNFRRAKLIYFKNILLIIFGLFAIFCSLVYCFLPSNF